MQKRGLILVLLVLVLVLSAFSNSAKDDKTDKIDKKVMNELSKEGKVKVLVQLKDNGKIGSKSQKKALKAVSENIGKEKIRHEFASLNGFSASLSLEDIAKLEQDDSVERVYYDRPVSVDLVQSVSIINATRAWALQSNGINLTGSGETICIIDTGVDYTHPDLGNCTPVRNEINGTNESYILESAHNYTNEFDYTWNITMPGYSKIGVHFRNLTTESTYDYVYVLDGSSKIVGVYSGARADFWSPSVEGDTISIRLKSDSSVADYGFYVDQVINGTTNRTYDWSNCSKVVGGWDSYNYDPDPRDDHGHGTHCAGIAAANGTIKGVAPGARIVAIKALGASGNGESGDVIAGIEWCVSHRNDFNISVISMSLGGGLNTSYCDSSDPLTAIAINDAVAKNISVVIAAGNDGKSAQISYPACIENATPIGSVDKSDALAGDTNRNSLVQLFATGVSISSTCMGGGSCTKSGTSMATPHTAGAFAIISQYLRLNGKTRTTQQIESVFNATGKVIYDSGSGLNFSRINVYDAINYLDLSPPNVSLISPDENYSVMENTAISFVYNVTDNGNISSCTLIINNVITDYNSSAINASSNNSFSRTPGVGSYNWSINCTDVWGNTGNSSSRSFAVNATYVPPSSGGGGGGGSTSSVYDAGNGELSSFSVPLKKGDKIRFRRNNENHTITLNFIWTNSINLTIASSPVYLSLNVGEEKRVNLSSRDYYDLLVRLEGITSGKANITIKNIYELIQKATAPAQNTSTDNETKIIPQVDKTKGRTYYVQNESEMRDAARGTSFYFRIGIPIAITCAIIIWLYLSKRNAGARD